MGHRCYLPGCARSDSGDVECIQISGEEAHHLIKVLRCRVGENVELLDGKGASVRGEITAVDRRTLSVRPIQTIHPQPPGTVFTLIQAVPKGKRQDLVLQKAVELGVGRIIFVQTEHVVSRIRPDEAADKLERWNQILIGALKQSGNPWLPEFSLAWNWTEVVTEACRDHAAVFLADLSTDALPLREELRRHRGAPSLAVCIGPEGDFSPGETEVARAAGCIPVNLGPRVLRTETAAFYLMSIFAYEFLN